jgi:hypothetical protein
VSIFLAFVLIYIYIHIGLCCADLKNAARELYGLVNYGEIRKKIGFCTEKIMCMKLNELVYKGTIQIRIKGKTLRIKTPICRALRKLNRLQGMYTVNFAMH